MLEQTARHGGGRRPTLHAARAARPGERARVRAHAARRVLSGRTETRVGATLQCTLGLGCILWCVVSRQAQKKRRQGWEYTQAHVRGVGV